MKTPIDLYNTLLVPISPIAVQMEIDGIKIDVEYINKLVESYKNKKKVLYQELINNIGIRFNYNSPKDLFYVIKYILKIELTKETKKGNVSLDSDVIDSICDVDVRLKPLKELKHLDKMNSTYLSGLLKFVKNGRVSPNWNIIGTETGRWTSKKPFAVQTLPRNKEIKRIIIPEKDYVLLAGDYRQAELRILAYYSKDPYLMEGAKLNLDMHAYSAALFFDIDPKKLTELIKKGDKRAIDMRLTSKISTFLIVYFGNEYALSHVIGKPAKECKMLIKRFLDRAKLVMKWSNDVIEFLKEYNYVISCYGRMRRFPLYNILSEDDKEKMKKEAPNAIIQGTSVDFCNYSLIAIVDTLKKEGLYYGKERVRVLSQKHDELLFEIPKKHFDLCKDLIKIKMEEAKFPVDIPMAIDLEASDKSYGDMKKI